MDNEINKFDQSDLLTILESWMLEMSIILINEKLTNSQKISLVKTKQIETLKKLVPEK